MYTYDSAGRPARMTHPFTQADTTLTSSVAGRVVSRVDPTGLEDFYSYDDAGRRASEVDTRASSEIARFSSAYDPASNVVARTRVVDGGQ